MKVGNRYTAYLESETDALWTMLCIAELDFNGAKYFVCAKDNLRPTSSGGLFVFDKHGDQVEDDGIEPFHLWTSMGLKPRGAGARDVVRLIR